MTTSISARKSGPADDRPGLTDRGRVVGRGGLAELLQECPEMRRLGSEEAFEEAEEVDPAQ